ncbi:MAG: polyprenyl synthetase family protein [Bacteroidales bacterium]
MLALKEVTEIIKTRIHQLDFNGAPKELYEPIKYTLNLGGKRLRPALCLLACDMVGGKVEKAVLPAIGIEIFHNFTLLHDDIMDNALIRRGKQTVHKKWNDNVAILSGDTMMALSYEYIMKAPEHVRSTVFSVFNKTAIEVCEGQQYDMNFESDDHVTIVDYLEMIRLKTAVLLAGSLKIGALIGGAEMKVANDLYRFGENMGIAFQLKDDLLDVFSDVEKFGKTSGGDIVANKKTYLYLRAFELAEGETLKNLSRIFSDKNMLPEKKIKQVKEIYQELDINNETGRLIDHYYHLAMKALSEIKLPEKNKKPILHFANQLKERVS